MVLTPPCSPKITLGPCFRVAALELGEEGGAEDAVEKTGDDDPLALLPIKLVFAGSDLTIALDGCKWCAGDDGNGGGPVILRLWDC